MHAISIVIPVREGGTPEVTLRSLGSQTEQNFDVIVSWDRDGNANRARNRGAEKVSSPFILFSDDDIEWSPDAIRALHKTLLAHPEADYAYGAYSIGEWVQCNRPFSAKSLLDCNYVSTMSLIRRSAFPGFDESIKRLQDWDLWLMMLENGSIGVSTGKLLFSTEKGNGITYGGQGPSYEEAKAIVRAKHGIC